MTVEEKAFAYQRELGMNDSVSDEHIVARRMGFLDGYKQAERDINREMIGRMQKVHEKWTDDMFKDFDYNITIQDPIRDAAQALVDAIERYVQQRCSRSELLNIKNKLKNLLK